MRNKKIMQTAITMILCVFALVVWGASFHRGSIFKARPPAIEHPAAVSPPSVQVIDSTILKLFRKVFQKFTGEGSGYTISGSISYTTNDDSTERGKPVNFLMCRKGKDLYYKLGGTETINFNGQYIFIDHDNRAVMVTSQQDVQSVIGYDTRKLKELLQSQGYQLRKTEGDGSETISMLSDHSEGVQEYTITFNTKSLHPERLFIRSSEFDATGTDRENTTEIRITQFESTAVLADIIPRDSQVKKNGEKWALSTKIQNYKIITP